jgi:hypothetical protein
MKPPNVLDRLLSAFLRFNTRYDGLGALLILFLSYVLLIVLLNI